MPYFNVLVPALLMALAAVPSLWKVFRLTQMSGASINFLPDSDHNLAAHPRTCSPHRQRRILLHRGHHAKAVETVNALVKAGLFWVGKSPYA
ncbi:hypothetical protein J4E70_14670 [Pseudohalocynthiibacter aestuariivivens]|jgi:hypothetical protein|uniref:hypothetical protein n=1 Tax=Pseudohalocynthiibacter aestuariivivens TaxID=1591409 RepID=UPI001BD431C4|nr:hypothetical protein [Pseudohalocynthiibacter aestuariivivens]MBS9718194.1 hypothetical protein [Pseudohalocynthiibacter aestuariivivens]